MKQILDLTKPLTDAIDIYSDANYRDPAFLCSEWSSVETQGYRVSALSLGTQTGTHIDAPNHFHSSGGCLEAVPLDNLIGRYCLLDLPKDVNETRAVLLCGSYRHEEILFVRSDNSGVSTITHEALDRLLELPPLVWVVEGEVSMAEGSAFEFHRLLAYRGKYLIENLNSEVARSVRAGGELIALPLALVGTSGAPCRVVVKQEFASA